MQSYNHCSFCWFSIKLVFISVGKPTLQRVQIDVENENSVKQVNKMIEIS